ncbi:uncharacterized protein LOC110717568 [Chenopodium quinoa]|uniref:uncharacterized protein LOC110717568 n=1 Tax=Chenopodium quinoa TaxID=63459 RepID=UPI000B771E41|nr:uncharacterized protein LOC110717568 [Chenopodium quinoa]
MRTNLGLRIKRHQRITSNDLHIHSVLSISNFFQSEGYNGPKPTTNLVVDWVSVNDNVARSLPIYVGGFSLLAVLFNRTVSGIAPIADPSRLCRGPAVDLEELPLLPLRCLLMRNVQNCNKLVILKALQIPN